MVRGPEREDSGGFPKRKGRTENRSFEGPGGGEIRGEVCLSEGGGREGGFRGPKRGGEGGGWHRRGDLLEGERRMMIYFYFF